MQKPPHFFLAVSFIALLMGACASPPVKQADPVATAAPVVPYEVEQTKGVVQVRLLKVERATAFTSQNVAGALPGKLYAVQTLGASLLVEALGEEPITNWNFGGLDITIGNRPFQFNGRAGAIRSPSSGEVPESCNRQRSEVVEDNCRPAPNQTGPISWKFETGFNGHSETFTFENIPQN